MRLGRDSTTLADIPVAGTQLVMVYANGLYRVLLQDVVAHFGPSMPVVWIDVNGSDVYADVLDVETGDATPAGAVVWVKAKLLTKPVYPPVIYCNRATLTPLFNAMGAAGLHVGTHFRLWVATLDGTRTVPDMTGVTAVQYAGEPQTGHHYDESIVYDDAWKAAAPAPKPAPAPAPKPAPVPVPVLNGVLVQLPAGVSRVVLSHDGGKTWA
jgi:hypothetical protein